jgi:hypothetical protein
MVGVTLSLKDYAEMPALLRDDLEILAEAEAEAQRRAVEQAKRAN